MLENYNYAKDLNEIILKKAENSRASVNQKAASLQKEMEEFQRKIANNAFLTQERAEQEQQRLLNKRQELQELDTRLSQELMSEQQKLNEQLRDSIVSQLRIFNKDKGFQVVLSNTGGDNVLLADDVYDITAALLEYLSLTTHTCKRHSVCMGDFHSSLCTRFLVFLSLVIYKNRYHA